MQCIHPLTHTAAANGATVCCRAGLPEHTRQQAEYDAEWAAEKQRQRQRDQRQAAAAAAAQSAANREEAAVAQEAKVAASAAAAREAAAEAEAAAAAAAMPRRPRANAKKTPVITNPMSKGRAARREAGGGPA